MDLVENLSAALSKKQKLTCWKAKIIGFCESQNHFLAKFHGAHQYLGPIWYVYLKTKNYYLKIFMKIRVDEKVY